MKLLTLTWAYIARSYYRWALHDMARGHGDYTEALIGELEAQHTIDRMWRACASS